jgi:hypothetical protein
MDDIENTDTQTFTYRWEDNLGRAHWVRSRVDIDPLDDFQLQVTLLPIIAEVAVLDNMIALGAQIAGMKFFYAVASILLKVACKCQMKFLACSPLCGPWNPGACACAAAALACWKVLCGAAKALLLPSIVLSIFQISTAVTLYTMLFTAWGGLRPAYTVSNKHPSSAWPYIITWIDDVNHNRLVRTKVTQHQQGQDLGIWRMRYPDITSFTKTDFRGNGSIYPVEMHHDASIVETDK